MNVSSINSQCPYTNRNKYCPYPLRETIQPVFSKDDQQTESPDGSLRLLMMRPTAA